MRKQLFVLLIMFIPYLASAQVGFTHGTVLIFNFTNDKFIVAADSLAIPDVGPPNYSYCKISAFGHQIVFAGVNDIAYFNAGILDQVPSWDGKEIARQIIKSEPTSQPSLSHINNIAERWASALTEKFQALYLWHPHDVIKVAKQGKGVLVAAIFVEAAKAIIYSRVAIVMLNQQSLLNTITWGVADGSDLADCWTCGQKDGKICAAGQTAIVTEFCTQSTERARGGGNGKQTYPASLFDLGWGSHSLLALRLADVTAAYDPSEVGGEIDVLELEKNGSIRWLAKKDNCPENQE